MKEMQYVATRSQILMKLSTTILLTKGLFQKGIVCFPQLILLETSITVNFPKCDQRSAATP